MLKKKMRCDASQESVHEDPTTNTEEVDEDNNGASDKNAKEAGEEQTVAEVEDSGPKKVGGEQPVVEDESGEDAEVKKVGGGQPVAEVASNEESLEVREPGDEQPVVDSAVDEGFEDDHTLVDAMDAASEAGGHQAGTEVNDDNEPECPSGTSVGEA
ncbi:hypothetical protein KIN20_038129 [Parelaphostrongylus tenuis]|uniref:Uncharacterized protein n=1 Tax=Parelaphostrongylus tenuis TaxID=148309 RepID=A0AAD5RIF9_PARTN|nr:hypothetical protein KIN20_038129 [Parelaphostrongylus tenuis]